MKELHVSMGVEDNGGLPSRARAVRERGAQIARGRGQAAKRKRGKSEWLTDQTR